MKTLFRHFGFALIVSAVALAAVGFLSGLQALLVVCLLAVLEVSFSFDNAVVNATVLQRMSPKWQKIFLSVGIIIAVFGMRLLFPIVIVSTTTSLDFAQVVSLAVNDPSKYAEALTSAHPAISAFGGAFLGLIFLDFVFEDRDIRWFAPVEKALARIGATEALSSVVILTALLVVSSIAGGAEGSTILFAGVAGVAVYLLVNGLSAFLESEGDEDDEEFAGISGAASKASGTKMVVGKAAFYLFLYLEVLDASFSFDGVIGAFAISTDIFIIAIGLGIGALFIRSMTVFLVKAGTLQEYPLLEHGAHYAIGALAVILLISSQVEVPNVVTGLIGVFFIAASLIASVVRNKKES